MYKLPEIPQTRSIKRIAVLTSGGDAPGMNAAIRAVVRSALIEEIDVLGVQRGFEGLINRDVRPLTSASVANILQHGGTLLKCGRSESFRDSSVRWQAAENLREMGVEALVVIGGNGSLTGAQLLEQETGLAVIGIPGSIDNDIIGTEDTIGFDTSVNTALDAIDRIRDTANAHERLFLIEVMGRNSGFIAAQSGIAGGAEMILVPERQIDLKAIHRRLNTDPQSELASCRIIIVAEGHKAGRTQRLALALEEGGFDPRVCILGHTQRGGSPSGHDRVLASCLGAMAVSHLLGGHTNCMIGVQQRQVLAIPLETVIQGRKELDSSMLDLATRLQA